MPIRVKQNNKHHRKTPERVTSTQILNQNTNNNLCTAESIISKFEHTETHANAYRLLSYIVVLHVIQYDEHVYATQILSV